MESDDGLRYSSAPARRERILEIVRDASFASAPELSRLLGVSEMTIRRDIKALAEEGRARAVHGGVSRVPDPAIGTDFRLRSMERQAAKQRIAREAIRLINPDTSIALDAGTTCLELARLLTASTHLTVVTPSLSAMAVLAERPGIQIVGVGGILHRESLSFAGPSALSGLAGLRVNQLFLAASAIGKGYLWCGNPWEAEMKRELIAIADQIVVLADASKFAATAMSSIAPLSSVHKLVVDEGISPEQRAVLEAEGIGIVLAAAASGNGRVAASAGADR